jgi:hypothetical protein
MDEKLCADWLVECSILAVQVGGLSRCFDAVIELGMGVIGFTGRIKRFEKFIK